MASRNLLSFLFPLLATLLAQVLASDTKFPFSCSATINNCNALLYHINKGLELDQIGIYYNVSPSLLTPISRGDKDDYLVPVAASCKTINGTTAYFYEVPYLVKQNDTFFGVSDRIYSGQVWEVGDEQNEFIAGNVVTMHLLSGCLESDSQIVGTYTVQQNDTITDIATRLSSTVNGIQSLNSGLIQDPNLLIAGWVLFVPMEPLALPPPPPPPYA